METKSVIETSNNVMKQLPSDIKKQLAMTSPSASLRVPILLYHYVEYVKDKGDTIRQSLDVNPNVFEDQIKTLQTAGFSFITAKQLSDAIDGKLNLPEKPILLTFDDGHWDLYTDVLPILKKYNVKATAYIVTGFIGGSDSLSKQQLQSIIDSKLIEIGAHTVHHISLNGRPAVILQKEIVGSKQTLNQDYHLNVVSFAYPNGSFDQQAIQAVKDAGFETAVSTIPGIAQNQSNKFFLYRIRPGGRSGERLLNFLSQNTFRAY